MFSKSLGKALSTSLVNQAVTSGTNFAIAVFLVRVMDKAEFGIYSLGYALLLILSGLIAASISVQYVVNLPEQVESERAVYAVNHASLVALVGFLSLVFTVVLIAVSGGVSGQVTELQAVSMAVVFTFTQYSFREFLVRVAYSARRESLVLLSSIIIAIVIVAGFALTGLLLGKDTTAAVALTVLGVSYSASAIGLVLLLQLPLCESSWQGLKAALADCWVGGRWNGMTSLVYSLRTQVHNLVVAPVLGFAALAEVNAARILVTPALMAIPPLSQVMMPRLADKLRRTDESEGIRQATHATLLLVSVASFYTLVLLVALPWLLPHVLGDVYGHTRVLVAAWCFVAIIMAARNGLTMIFQVVKRFRGLMLVNTLAAVVGLSLSIILAWSIGSVGAILALLAAELFLCTLLAFMLSRIPDRAHQ